MSGGPACRCAERKEPLEVRESAARPARLWRVVDHRCNYSKFSGSRWTISDYSSITCLRCGRWWRTKAAYADIVKSRAADERDISHGHAAHAKAMKKLGREPYNREAEHT